jgi:hypothetical protein
MARDGGIITTTDGEEAAPGNLTKKSPRTNRPSPHSLELCLRHDHGRQQLDLAAPGHHAAAQSTKSMSRT